MASTLNIQHEHTAHTDDASSQPLAHSDPGGLDVNSVENLSSIVAFNQNYNSDTTSNVVAITSQWGKRSAEQAAHTQSDDPNKRPHLDLEPTLRMSPGEQQVHDQIQAHMAASVYQQTQQQHLEHSSVPFQQNQGHQESQHLDQSGLQVQYDDDDENDPEFELDEDQDAREQEQMNAMMVAQEGNSWMGLMDNPFALWDANQSLRIHSLPILDNLSSQILQTLGKGPYTDTLNIVTQPDSGEGQAYNTMKSLFDQTKKLYTHEAFLSADELKLDIPDQRCTIRKVNLATFVSSVFGSQEVGFFHLNEHFLDTFVPDGGRLLKSQGSLYLDLKTQAYISAMSTNERSKEEILDDLFPDNMSQILLARRPGAKQLTPSEQDFVARLQHRRQHLKHMVDDVNLSEKYVWQDFLKEVSWYVSKNHETIVAQATRKPRKRMSHGCHGPEIGPVVLGTPSHSQSVPPMGHQQSPPPLSVEDGAAAAIVQAHTAAHTHNNPPHTPPNLGHSSAAEVALDTELFGPNTSYMGAPPLAQPPIPQQSQPTQVLYERARIQASSKSSTNARRAGLPSQRRPWSTEEENALMAGLDRVKGPHWSQILAMFGPGGTVSEALKDRNQVQLKDKARNLKLFFLKSGIEVPYYLQFVTGELKTRAPGQAAKNAAKKAVEASAEEDAAHVAAVTALGNAHRDDSVDMSAYQSMGGISASPEMINHQESEQEGSVPPQPDMGLQTSGLAVGNPPLVEQTQQVSLQAPMAPMAPVAPMASMAPMAPGASAQQPEQESDENDGEGSSDRVDPSLIGVDPQLRTSVVGHEVSAERGT